MDTQTRHALKTDSFLTAARSGIDWLNDRSGSAYIAGIILVVLVLLGVGGYFYNQHRNDLAAVDFGAAMDTYNAPVQQPGEPAAPGVTTYPTSADRARAAASQFEAIASNYKFTQTAANSRYFAGLTYMEAGENATAESDLKEVAGSWDRNLSTLAKTALATLYHQTGRDDAAIDLLNQVAAKPSATVSATTAKLELAGLYENSNRPDDARKIYAQLKDQDKDGMAGRIASSKLSPTSAQ
jgi:predicted negative regulator of RcsB-dependent stress response